MLLSAIHNVNGEENVTWLLITVWHFIVVVDKDMKSCLK